MIGVAVFVIAWVCAASVDTAWQFGVNNLSEFGISDTDARLYFNYGCILAGIIVAIFGAGRALNTENAGHTAGGAFIAVGGVFLALIGVFTMDSSLHNLVAVSAALFILMGIVAVTAGNWAADRKIIAGAGIVFVVFLSVMLLVFDVAELEAYGIILALVWFLIESVNMILLGKKG
jgi:hypothetical membrane protein